jgi:hypothetical protein
MVGLRAKVLGRLGRTTSPHPRACALSCPSRVIAGAGPYGVPALSLAALLSDLTGGAAFASVTLELLRGTSGAATMITPRRAGHTS